jgi:hypothetical protein
MARSSNATGAGLALDEDLPSRVITFGLIRLIHPSPEPA